MLDYYNDNRVSDWMPARQDRKKGNCIKIGNNEYNHAYEKKNPLGFIEGII